MNLKKKGEAEAEAAKEQAWYCHGSVCVGIVCRCGICVAVMQLKCR